MPDGGHRVTAVEITGDRYPVCLINVYMPSRSCPDSDTQFQSTLDEVHEILEKYGHTHKILLGVTSTHHYTKHNLLEGTNCCKASCRAITYPYQTTTPINTHTIMKVQMLDLR